MTILHHKLINGRVDPAAPNKWRRRQFKTREAAVNYLVALPLANRIAILKRAVADETGGSIRGR